MTRDAASPYRLSWHERQTHGETGTGESEEKSRDRMMARSVGPGSSRPQWTHFHRRRMLEVRYREVRPGRSARLVASRLVARAADTGRDRLVGIRRAVPWNDLAPYEPPGEFQPTMNAFPLATGGAH